MSDRAEVGITAIGGWGDLRGHWHWFTESDGITIDLIPPMGGEYGWNCLCDQKITHELTQNAQGAYTIGNPISNHREW